MLLTNSKVSLAVLYVPVQRERKTFDIHVHVHVAQSSRSGVIGLFFVPIVSTALMMVAATRVTTRVAAVWGQGQERTARRVRRRCCYSRASACVSALPASTRSSTSVCPVIIPARLAMVNLATFKLVELLYHDILLDFFLISRCIFYVRGIFRVWT